jgi:hypothetical protein
MLGLVFPSDRNVSWSPVTILSAPSVESTRRSNLCPGGLSLVSSMTAAKKQGSGGAESLVQTGVAWWDRKYPRQVAVFTTNRPGY